MVGASRRSCRPGASDYVCCNESGASERAGREGTRSSAAVFGRPDGGTDGSILSPVGGVTLEAAGEQQGHVVLQFVGPSPFANAIDNGLHDLSLAQMSISRKEIDEALLTEHFAIGILRLGN